MQDRDTAGVVGNERRLGRRTAWAGENRFRLRLRTSGRGGRPWVDPARRARIRFGGRCRRDVFRANAPSRWSGALQVERRESDSFRESDHETANPGKPGDAKPRACPASAEWSPGYRMTHPRGARPGRASEVEVEEVRVGGPAATVRGHPADRPEPSLAA